MNRVLISLVVGLAVFFAGLGTGVYLKGNAVAASELKAGQAQQAESVRKVDAATVAAIANANAAQKQAVIYRTITKEIIKYAENHASGPAWVDPEWVRIHNAAAAPDLAASGDASDSSGSATATEAIGIVASNYELCNQYAEQVRGWQGWCRSQGLCR
ncbi:MAG: hypothetical protein NT086_19910 [Proteobacteria bacterium]|nr:hypothetical protein [Pseudomonadota bacterium]